MKGLSVIIVGGGAGPGALLARMAVDEGAAGLGIIDRTPMQPRQPLRQRAALPTGWPIGC